MLSHDELNGTNAAAPAFTQEVLHEEVLLSGDDACTGGEEGVLFGDEYAREEVEEGEILPVTGQEVDLSDQDWEEHGSVGDVQCPECGKYFKNDKSMFGHLRSHPNRGYKGATPPTKPSATPPTKPKKLLPNDDGIASPVDKVRYSQRDPNLNSYEVLAAYVMLTLKSSDDQAAPVAPDNKRKYESGELDVPEEELVMSKGGADVMLSNHYGSSAADKPGDDAVRRNNHDSAVAVLAGSDMVLRDEHASSVAGMNAVLHNEHGSSSVAEVPRKAWRKKSKEGREGHRKEKGVRSPKEKRPYICKHCPAEFPSHQALGGHMAAHNKEKRIQAQIEQAADEAHLGKVEQSLNRQEANCGSDESRRASLPLSTRELLMERYNTLFQEGWQSRQGYVRQHIDSKDGDSPMIAPLVIARDRHRLLDIDLNVEAPEKE
ncbi:hypothetical protein BRADI_1g42950v3 [Brachypodium distachyon]|uniref:C2H2-type domain-containing protein n=2 Tax=Brachypodium distachyon TaxID=15368 RepID=A0A0Q3JLH5_BRADI|nr:hypothetical protein BRADI_1g42950v3 [Brachypodium distachyon]